MASSATSDKMKGAANEAMGKMKRGLGKALNNPKLKAKGDLQEAKGDALKARGKAKSITKKMVKH